MSRTSKEDAWFLEYAGCRIALAAWAQMSGPERKHLLFWLRRMLKSNDIKERVAVGNRIVNLYGRPRGFGRRLRHTLFERNISNQEFARMLGTTAKHVSRWLAGDSSPNRVYRLRVAHVLGLDDEELSNADRDYIAG